MPSRTILNRLLPQSLAGRLIALLLLVLLLSQIASGLVFFRERREAIDYINREYVLARVTSVIRLVRNSPPEVYRDLVRATNTRKIRFFVRPEPAVPGDNVQSQRDNMIATEIRARVSGLDDEIRIMSVDRRNFPDHGGDLGLDRPGRPFDGVLISIRMPDENWLNVAAHSRPARSLFRGPWFFSLLLSSLAIAIVVILVIRRITKPLNLLAQAADRLGRGEETEPLEENGPREVRRATAAFNIMRERLDKFVSGRTRMLAAISHDLRTPITSLRLRAEFVDDDENREKIISTLDEMQSMVEATLAFARDDAQTEETVTRDIGQLVGELAQQYREMDRSLALEISGPVMCRCRPTSIRRALSNLVDNALTYGENVKISVGERSGQAQVLIDDDGPGLPEDRLDEIFEPFVRLEESRNRETGGVGLGLSIARSIVRNHGGEIVLSNRKEGGLRAMVLLPLAPAA